MAYYIADSSENSANGCVKFYENASKDGGLQLVVVVIAYLNFY